MPIKSSFRLPLIASLLIGLAVVLVAIRSQRNDDTPARSGTAKSSDRSAPPARDASSEELARFSRQLGASDRKTWVRGLNDSELERLTDSVIGDYFATSEQPERQALIPLLTLLAKEYGRRDIEGFYEKMAVIEISSGQDIYSLQQLRRAALIGLASEEPQQAWSLYLEGEAELTNNPRSSSYFIILPNLPAATESIIRAWAKKDAAAAWEAVSNSPSSLFAVAARGILAETRDQALRSTILERVAAYVYDHQQAQDSNDVIARNTIDAILNNPNRNRSDHERLLIEAALGLAEQDPKVALEWFESSTKVERKTDSLGNDEVFLTDIPIIGRLFLTPTDRFVAQWAERQPVQVAKFAKEQLKDLSASGRKALADSLGKSEPLAALAVLQRIPDPSNRYQTFTRWLTERAEFQESFTWPLLQDSPRTMPADQALSLVARNLQLLDLPPAEYEKAQQLLEQTIEGSTSR